MDSSVVRSLVAAVGRFLPLATTGSAMLMAVVASPPCAAQTVELRVGQHGDYATIQDALAGVVDGGVNDVRIESGTYPENVEVSVLSVVLNSGELHLSGGWDETFSVQTADPALTLIDGDGAGRCVSISLSNVTNTLISVSNLTMSGGVAETGGGLRFFTVGRVFLEISECIVSGNTSVASIGSPYGGGVFADVSGLGSGLRIRDTSIEDNLAWFDGSGGSVRGGGAYLEVEDSAPVFIERVTFLSNLIAADNQIEGAGCFLWVDDGAVGEVSDSWFEYNQALTTADPTVRGTGLFVTTLGSGWARLRRDTLLVNLSQTGSGEQLYLTADHTSDLRAEDTLVAAGNEGVIAIARESARLDLTNLTVVENLDVGLAFVLHDVTTSASLYNSVVFANGTDLDLQPGPGVIGTGHNLVGVDPVFVDAFSFDYRLSAGSPAEDGGTNSPPAGLGDADCDGGVRVIDSVVDIGAYEGIGVLFSDPFADGTRRWSRTVGD